MYSLICAAVVFVVLHRGVSGSPLRPLLIARLGESAYLWLFQFASIGVLAWLVVAYRRVGAPASLHLWLALTAVVWLQYAVQAIGVLLVVAGLTTRNPGTSRSESAIDRANLVKGALRVTRHPFLWGIGLFALGHLATAPSPRNLVLFGTLAFVALTGTRSIDAKRRRSIGAKWDAFEAQTSNLPFAAILDRRQSFGIGEWAWWQVALALVVYAVAVHLHS